MRRTLVSPDQVINTVTAQMRSRLEDRPVENAIVTNLADVYVDRDLIQLSLRQLVDNALKHAPGKSAIRLGAGIGDSDVQFWVSDDGPGITAPEADRVFERFYRGRSHRNAVPGSGIGLSVVREIARAHGGDAFVESSPGKGSRFIIKLPLTTEELR